MTYRYVDRIFSITDTEAVALKLVTRQEPYWVWFESCKYLNPIILVESLIQLTEWWVIVRSNFTRVSVPVSSKEIDFKALVSFGERLDLGLRSKGETGDLKEVSLSATKDGESICSFDLKFRVEELSSMYDEFQKRTQYKNIFRPELVDDEKISGFRRYRELSKNIENVGYDFIDTVDRLDSSRILFSMNIPACTYYIDDRMERQAPLGPVLMCGMEGASFLNQGKYSSKRIDMKLVKIRDLSVGTLFRQGSSVRFSVEKNKDVWSMKAIDLYSKSDCTVSCNMIFE